MQQQKAVVIALSCALNTSCGASYLLTELWPSLQAFYGADVNNKVMKIAIKENLNILYIYQIFSF